MQYVFLFPGQGSQSVGMGKYLSEIPSCKKTFDEVSKVLGDDFVKLMWEGPEDILTQTFNAQPAILSVSVAIGRYLMENGVTPTIMAGHSLGEYTCLVLSNAMTFSDALLAVQARGQFMQEAVPAGQGTMCAVLGVEDSLIEEVCNEVTQNGDLVEPANYNCPGQLVISGTVSGVEKASKILKERGAKRCVPLTVSAPFHSSLLAPASAQMASYLEKISVASPSIPYVANVDVETIMEASQIKPRLVSQIDHPVRWTQTLQKLTKLYPDACYIEVGAAKVVSGHLKKVHPDASISTTDTIDTLNAILAK